MKVRPNAVTGEGIAPRVTNHIGEYGKNGEYGEVVDITADDVGNSRFLRKEKLPTEKPQALQATVRRTEKANVAPLGEPPEQKYIVTWEEDIPPLVLNKTNAEKLWEISGSRSSRGWPGTKVGLWNNLSVTFQGQRGGVRICEPRPALMKMSQPVADDVSYNEDDQYPTEAENL
jgi:hypothetical protein